MFVVLWRHRPFGSSPLRTLQSPLRSDLFKIWTGGNGRRRRFFLIKCFRFLFRRWDIWNVKILLYWGHGFTGFLNFLLLSRFNLDLLYLWFCGSFPRSYCMGSIFVLRILWKLGNLYYCWDGLAFSLFRIWDVGFWNLGLCGFVHRSYYLSVRSIYGRWKLRKLGVLSFWRHCFPNFLDLLKSWDFRLWNLGLSGFVHRTH